MATPLNLIELTKNARAISTEKGVAESIFLVNVQDMEGLFSG